MLIRRMRADDLEELYGLLSDEAVMEHLEPVFTREKTRGFLEKAGLCDKPLILAAEECGRFVGYAIYHDYDASSREIGWVLKPCEWGRGYAKRLTALLCERAFSEGKDAVIECSPLQGASRHIALLSGFRYCGMEDGREVYRKKKEETDMEGYRYITLRERPELMDSAAEWFHGKWGVPKEAYIECMEDYLSGRTELGWYLCLNGEEIVGGLGAIENDFHDRKDLSPNICAVFTEPEHRCRGIAGRLLDLAVEELRGKGISPVYLLTDHTGFYERYGWEFYCMAQGDGEPQASRLYIHR